MGSAAADPRAARELKRCWGSLLLIIVFFLSSFFLPYGVLLSFAQSCWSGIRNREEERGLTADVHSLCLIVLSSSNHHFRSSLPSTINSFRQVHTEYIAVGRSFAVAQPWKTWRVDIRCWKSWGVSVFPGVFGRVGLQEADVVTRWELWNCIQSH